MSMHSGMNFLFLFFNLIGLLILAAGLILAIFTLFTLKKTPLTPTATALWVLIILAVPVMGAAAYWIIRPKAEQPPTEE